MVLGVNYRKHTIERDAVASRSLRKSASADHGRIEQLWDQFSIGYLVTITLNSRVDFTAEIVFVDVTFGLCFSAESYNFKHKAIVDLTCSKFHRIEINYHAAVFRSKLHWLVGLNLNP